METKGNYYITTAIAYTSGKPHIGNVYEIVLADAVARFKRLEGYGGEPRKTRLPCRLVP